MIIKTLSFALALCASAVSAEKVNQYSRHLRFRKDRTFKIVTFSDLAMNDNSEDYLQTQSLIEKVLTHEDPDLIVLTGDVVDPAFGDDYAYHFTSALELIKSNNLPYVWTGGNHVPGMTKHKMYETDYSYGRSLSHTGYVWDQHVEDFDGKSY